MEKNGAFGLFETSVKETVTFAYIMTFHCTSVWLSISHFYEYNSPLRQGEMVYQPTEFQKWLSKPFEKPSNVTWSGILNFMEIGYVT